MRTGILYVVATPLGNLGDLSARAAEVLRTVPVVAAEDTRRTRGLLTHLGVAPTVLSFHAYSDDHRLDSLLDILRSGRDVALVSDAGTPTVSDPGMDLVARSRAAGIQIVPIPGASAVATALSASGLAGDRYLFLGFIPRKGRERTRLLTRASTEEWSVVFYEAPPRLVALLQDLISLAGADRTVVVARELTKLHEEIRSGSLGELADYYAAVPPKGEITVVLQGTGMPAPEPDRTEDAMEHASLLLAEGLTRREVVRRLTDTLGMPRNEAYKLVMELP
ncbi:MAG TPA: 16S rRNA (cytidine(1402)-2'-O)-methyltransferase [Gemmatimonadales bacterium]|jgi:16S rRNA (cytidine1402-2'-O)-methyltransferase|nr:16S rRNA (cytidine(1402)-2'-O)-methyltransferase [Gemmatimonadales bacterium]HZA98259.1 16S rRNA (cytidine(1402)-2'-O)-methyltransferase [Gemmatimonadales bacterium]